MQQNNSYLPVWLKVILKLILFVFVGYISIFFGVYALMLVMATGVFPIFGFIAALLFPLLIVPLIFVRNKKRVLKYWSSLTLVWLIAFSINFAYVKYNERITVDTSPNIDIFQYLPFDENSKIVELDGEASLKLEDNLPVVDGAAALFPVYSAFVNEVYPNTVEIYDEVFQYNNTLGGYQLLAEKKIDIFFGAYPSSEQIDYATSQGTEFIYTPIGVEAFVFFVHQDNPVDSLTSEQIQSIYAGEITNWSGVGGDDKKIVAFQRNEGSGSQSMLVRFMDGKKIMEAPSELVSGLMSGIVEQVSDYKNKNNSIGFSFRYYLEGIIQNPDIKLLGIDGIAPSVENIKNGSYPITTPIYAVTYKGNDNENIAQLIEWILSSQGQEIIEKTGYVGISN